MADHAFARCEKFLNYHPLAKWLSVVSSIATALLYVGLIIVLGFYIDLIVEHGEIPGFFQLPEHQRNPFLVSIAFTDDPEARTALQHDVTALGFKLPDVKNWDNAEPIEKWTERERAILWWAYVHDYLEKVSPNAAAKMRSEMERSIQKNKLVPAPFRPLENCGLLSLVVRTHTGFHAWLIARLAAWNEWMWGNGNVAYLFGLFLVAGCLAVLRLGFAILSRYLGAAAVLEAITRLRRLVYHHTNRLGTLAFRALGPAEAVSVSTRHLEAVHDGLFNWLTVYFREPVKLGLLLAFTFAIDFWLAVAFFVIAILVWLIGSQIAAYFRRRSLELEADSADQLALIQESLMLMRLVKVYLMEGFNQTRVEQQLKGYARAQLLRYRGEAINRSVFVFLGLLAALILLLVAGFVIMSDQLSVANALTLAAAVISLYWPLLAFLEARRIVRRGRQSAKIVFDFLDRQEGVRQAIEAEFIPLMTKMIQFDKVSLREPGTGRRLLTNISFTIKAGEKVAIVGPDEMLKHALVYLLPRFLDPSHGEVRIDGKNLRWVTLDSLRAQIAMVLQHNLVFNDTVANNIGCGDPGYNLQKIVDAAKLAHAHQFITRLPNGYETVIGELGHTLNLGEMFRIALARALVREPAILVIEEPTTPLDEDTNGMIDDTLQRAAPGRTVIYLPHRVTTIRGCDQVFLFFEGKLEAAGDHRELLNTSELYRHLQYMEFNEYAGVFPPPAPAKEEEVSEPASDG